MFSNRARPYRGPARAASVLACALAHAGCTDAPVEVADPGPRRIEQIDAGYREACARFSDGTLACWGENAYGQLGFAGPTTAVPLPVPSAKGVAQISCNGKHTCALYRSGRVACWGDSSSLARFDDPGGPEPVFVEGLSGILQIGDGQALGSDGRMLWWGFRYGKFDPSATPMPLLGIFDVVRIDKRPCAIVADGTARCWGWNDDGELGTGDTLDSNDPRLVVGLDDLIQIARGTSHTCALRADGTVWCWGANGDGELGDASGEGSLVAKQIQTLSSVVQISSGSAHSCALLQDGSVWCWG